MSYEFPVNKAVRLGDPKSLKLLIVVVDVFRNNQCRRGTPYKLGFANDVAPFNEETKQRVRYLHRSSLNSESLKVGLKINKEGQIYENYTDSDDVCTEQPKRKKRKGRGGGGGGGGKEATKYI